MSSSPKSTTSTTRSEPWEGQKPYLQNLYSAAQQAYQQTPRGVNPNPVVAGPNATQEAALGASQQYADSIPGRVQQLDALRSGAPQFSFNPAQQQWTGGGNQYLAAMQEAALRPVTEQYTQNILPQLSSQAAQAGAFGGTRAGLVQAQAANDFARTAGDISSQLAFQTKESGLNRDFSAWQQNNQQAYDAATRQFEANRDSQMTQYQMAPELIQLANSMAAIRPQVMMGIGDTRQQWAQDQLTNQNAMWDRRQAAPWAGLDRLAEFIQGGGYPGQATQQTTPRPSQMQGALSGALGGASMGAALGPWGALGGLALGGLAGLF